MQKSQGNRFSDIGASINQLNRMKNNLVLHQIKRAISSSLDYAK
jgi:hypothetical protein